MRNNFLKALEDLAVKDNRIWLLCGDLGYSVLEKFATRFPNRFLNAGVAEQNMIGVAAGLAMTGKIVFTYSIANFPTMRCYEQIRNDICYHNLNVKIVSVGGGLVYGTHGYTHQAVEDLAAMRILPNMSVLAPGDPMEAIAIAKLAVETQGPCYIRLGKSGEPKMHKHLPEIQIAKAVTIREGHRVTLISTGSILSMTIAASDELVKQGISPTILSMPCLWPLDVNAIIAAAKRGDQIITIEEHGIGGLGSAVAEVLAISGICTPFKSLHLQQEPMAITGSQAYLFEQHGLTVQNIVSAARNAIL